MAHRIGSNFQQPRYAGREEAFEEVPQAAPAEPVGSHFQQPRYARAEEVFAQVPQAASAAPARGQEVDPSDNVLDFGGNPNIPIEDINKTLEALGPRIESVDLSGLVCQEVPRLSLCPNIKNLKITGVRFLGRRDSPEGEAWVNKWTSEIRALPLLETVDISFSQLTGRIFSTCRTSFLRVFRAANTDTSDNAVRMLSEICPYTLTDLDLENCPKITHNAFYFISAFQKIENCNFKRCKIITNVMNEIEKAKIHNDIKDMRSYFRGQLVLNRISRLPIFNFDQTGIQIERT